MIMQNNIIFHSLCIDNFFENPDIIRKWGLSLKFKSDNTGYWPGVRSDLISNIDANLNNLILSKVFSYYINFEFTSVEWKSSQLGFQKIKKFSNKKNDIKNKGWIHQDVNYDLAGVIYLTPNIDPDTGTSLYFSKHKDTVHNQSEKINLYKNNKFNKKKYEKQLLSNNNMFVEKTRFFNFYNRMICYDAKEFHGANNFYNKNDDERLTLVFFIKDISFNNNPNCKNFLNNNINFNYLIEDRIKALNEIIQ